MTDKMREILKRHHMEVNADADYYVRQWENLPFDTPEADRVDANLRRFRYQEIARRVDLLIQELLLEDL